MISAVVIDELPRVGDWVRWASSQFVKAGLFFGHGTDNAWDEAVQLVFFGLALPLDSNERILESYLTRAERETLYQLIKRRIEERVPLPYITQQAWFMGLSFYVDSRVLIPRSPLGECISREFEPWLVKGPERILDIGTGSGCLAIACAYVFVEAQVDAVDISAEALAVAKRNVEEHGLVERVRLLRSNCFDGLESVVYDLIISNPPYVGSQEMASLPSEYYHEPHSALEAADDGLAIVFKILRNAPNYLNPEGLLVMDVGNSDFELMKRLPQVPFTWLDLTQGGNGIFLLTREQLLEIEW